MNTERADDGFTLVELTVYIIILVIVMLAAGTFLVNVLKNQGNVRDTAEASNDQQLAFKALETDMRSASWVIIRQAGDLAVMQTRVVGGGSVDEERCVGYFLDQSTGDFHRTMSTSGTETKAALAAANAAAVASVAADWPVFATDVSPGAEGAAFTADSSVLGRGDTVTMSLEAATNDDWIDVTFEKSVSLRPQSSTILGCY